MKTIWALACVVIKELYRRKDFYVLFVLTALITIAAGSANFFNDSSIGRYLKDICLLLIWLSTLIIAVVTTARQIPAEKENRTIFPLLAKPVSRLELVIGKFLGCWIATGLALLVFYTFFVIVTGARSHEWQFGAYFKAIGLQWMMLGVIVAMTMLGSVVFSAVSATATICLIVVGGILFIGEHLVKIAIRQAEPLNTILYAIYFCIPHLELFDVRQQLVNNQTMPGILDCGLAGLYAATYIAVILVLTWLRFRRSSLNT
ncbi:MAG TPA: ABC transporter permease subunit [Verrucomicrobiae bacterium]|nr:ABC transporter permease subunit [Verrucomicrobiae bacterium]